MRLLGENGGVLKDLSGEFEIVVERFDASRTKLWESTLAQSAPLPKDPREWTPQNFVSVTQLGVAIAGSESVKATSSSAALSSASDSSETDNAQELALGGPSETIVLLSDGRNTAGVSPLAVAEKPGHRA